MMRFNILKPLLVMLALAVSGCSGGGSGQNAELGDGDTGDLTPPVDLPISGTAQYDGFLTLSLPTQSGRQPFSGTLGLDVDFNATAAQVTGEANQFRTPTNELLTGRIMITDGQIDRGADIVEDYTFEAGLSGTLSGSEFRNIVITGTLLGDFNGEEATTVSGQAFGDVVTPLGFDIFNGTFSGARP